MCQLTTSPYISSTEFSRLRHSECSTPPKCFSLSNICGWWPYWALMLQTCAVRVAAEKSGKEMASPQRSSKLAANWKKAVFFPVSEALPDHHNARLDCHNLQRCLQLHGYICFLTYFHISGCKCYQSYCILQSILFSVTSIPVAAESKFETQLFYPNIGKVNQDWKFGKMDADIFWHLAVGSPIFWPRATFGFLFPWSDFSVECFHSYSIRFFILYFFSWIYLKRNYISNTLGREACTGRTIWENVKDRDTLPEPNLRINSVDLHQPDCDMGGLYNMDELYS